LEPSNLKGTERQNPTLSCRSGKISEWQQRKRKQTFGFSHRIDTISKTMMPRSKKDMLLLLQAKSGILTIGRIGLSPNTSESA
jgi:hypothetical protein